MTGKFFHTLCAQIRACDRCAQSPSPLPHKPRPILCGNSTARIRIIGQAPGTRVHNSGVPFDDPSGDRLRDWLGITHSQFYNPDIFAITPMGFCFPGLDEKGSDLPPRRECAPLWQDKLTQAFTHIQLTLLVGIYAQKYHLGKRAYKSLTETVRHWQDYGPHIIPLPHPSWRNNHWLKRNSWFKETLNHLRLTIATIIDEN